MELKIIFRTDGNNPNKVTVGPPSSSETTLEFKGEADELMPFFDKLEIKCQQTQTK